MIGMKSIFLLLLCTAAVLIESMGWRFSLWVLFVVPVLSGQLWSAMVSPLCPQDTWSILLAPPFKCPALVNDKQKFIDCSLVMM